MAKAEWSQTNVLHTCHSYTENFFGLKNILISILYASSYDGGVHSVHGTTQSLLYLITLKPRVMMLDRQLAAVSDHFNSNGLRQVRIWSILILSLVRWSILNIFVCKIFFSFRYFPHKLTHICSNWNAQNPKERVKVSRCKQLRFPHSINRLQNLFKRRW